MTSLKCASLLATFLMVPSIAEGQAAQGMALHQLGFLSGRWVSETPAEVQEETWTPAAGESMTGTFRVVRNGRPVFYEFWAVEIEDNHPVLKLKHFDAGLVGWEEKAASTKMPLISAATDDAVFAEPDGSVSLHYHLQGNKLTCIVHHVKHGKASDETFTMTRAPAD